MQQLCDVGLPQHLLGLMSAITTRLPTARAAVATNNSRSSSSSSSSNSSITESHLLKLSCALFGVQEKLVVLRGDSLTPWQCQCC
jgi:hypothetical protein